MVSHLSETLKTISQRNHRILALSYPYFANVIVKLKLLRKSSEFLLLGVINITLVLRFVKRNKFYCVQTAKVVDLKDFRC